jgi:hypothetical protein
VKRLDAIAVELESPIATRVTVAIGSTPVTVALKPNEVVSTTVPASGVRGFQSFAYLLTARSTEGFVPHLLDPANMDYRNLGAQLRFTLVSNDGK